MLKSIAVFVEAEIVARSLHILSSAIFCSSSCGPGTPPFWVIFSWLYSDKVKLRRKSPKSDLLAQVMGAEDHFVKSSLVLSGCKVLTNEKH